MNCVWKEKRKDKGISREKLTDFWVKLSRMRDSISYSQLLKEEINYQALGVEKIKGIVFVV